MENDSSLTYIKRPPREQWQPYCVNGIVEEHCLFQTDSTVCKVKIDRSLENVKVIFSFGGFSTEEAAIREGENLFFNVKKEFIKQGIPINISGGLRVLDTTQTSFNTGGLTQYGLENIHLIFPQLVNTTVKNEILGMGIYQLDEDISEVKFIGQSTAWRYTVNARKSWCSTSTLRKIGKCTTLRRRSISANG